MLAMGAIPRDAGSVLTRRIQLFQAEIAFRQGRHNDAIVIVDELPKITGKVVLRTPCSFESGVFGCGWDNWIVSSKNLTLLWTNG